jgi:hypothetical protein
MKVVARSNFFGQGTSFRTGREYEVADKFGKVLVKAGKADAVKGSSAPAPATTSTPATTTPPAPVEPVKVDEAGEGEADSGEVVSESEQTSNADGGDQTDGEADKEPTTGENDKTNAKKGSK